MTGETEEEATPATEALLERLRAGEPAVVPAHWSAEVMNGLIMAVRRGRIDLERVARPLIWRSPNGPACPSPLQAEITRRAAVHGRAVEAYPFVHQLAI